MTNVLPERRTANSGAWCIFFGENCVASCTSLPVIPRIPDAGFGQGTLTHFQA